MEELVFFYIALIALGYFYLSQIFNQILKHKYNQPVFSIIFGGIVAFVYFLIFSDALIIDSEFLSKIFLLFLPLIMVDAALKINKSLIT